MNSLPRHTGNLWLREAPAVILLTLGFAAQVALAHGWSGLSRQLWIDEFFTQAIVLRGSPAEMLRCLAQGADCSPPGMYLLLGIYLLPWPQVDEFALRSFFLLCGLLTLLGLYANLRLVHHRLVSGTAAIAAMAHPLIAEQAYNARFYLPWLAATAWCSFFMARARDDRHRWSRANRIGLAVCSAILCTLHYFGVFTLAAMLAVDWLLNRGYSKLGRANLLALAAGPLALALCSPLYFGQRGALTVATWVEPIRAGQVNLFVSSIVPAATLSSAAILWWLSFCHGSKIQARRASECIGRLSMHSLARRACDRSLGKPPHDLPPSAEPAALPQREAQALAPLWGLFFFMPFLILFSALAQPSLIPRYGIVAALSFAPPIAALLARSARPLVVIGCVWFLFLGGLKHQAAIDEAMREQRAINELIANLRRCPDRLPVVFESSHDLFPVARYAPDLASRCYYLDFEPGQLAVAPRSRLFSRDVTRLYARLFAGCQLQKLSELPALPECLVVRSRFAFEIDPRGYPPFTRREVAPRVWQLTQDPSEK